MKRLLALTLVLICLLASGFVTITPTRIATCDSQHSVECRQAVAYWRAKTHRLERAVAWQKNERASDAERSFASARGFGVEHAIRLAAATFGVSLTEMNRVASCESGHNAFAHNPGSTAAGLFQWLSGSWSAQGIPGFSVYDPYANAMAAARARSLNGSWRQWNASRGCWS